MNFISSLTSKIFSITFAVIVFIQICSAQTGTIDYFGQTPPGDDAVMFATGILSRTDRLEAKIAFAPDGSECYFEVVEIKDNKASYKIYYSKRVNNTWTDQVEAPFLVNNNVGSPVFSVDGKNLYFTKYNTAITTSDIWMVERTTGGWGEPQLLPAPINSSSYELGYTETADSVIYFDSNRSGGYGGFDIWCKRPSSDKAENLGSILNSNLYDSDPCIAPDGSYLIFSTERYQSAGGNLLCISFNKGNNSWTAPVNMNNSGAKINNNVAHHGSPSLSPDGKYLFFFRHSDLMVMDVYWVSTHVLIGLKKAVFAPKLSKQIPNVNTKTDSVFTYVIPNNTFSCEYGTETLKYTATLNNGLTLPSWLTFDAGTRTFSGTPKQAEINTIKITATNKDTVSASCTFKITITNSTGIEENHHHHPSGLRLDQNYPNPFNPSTVISYQLSVSGKVILQIHDALGREVKTLVNSFQDAGGHSIVWDATDERNNPVSSGIYFYQMKIDNQILQKKMLLLR